MQGKVRGSDAKHEQNSALKKKLSAGCIAPGIYGNGLDRSAHGSLKDIRKKTPAEFPRKKKTGLVGPVSYGVALGCGYIISTAQAGGE